MKIIWLFDDMYEEFRVNLDAGYLLLAHSLGLCQAPRISCIQYMNEDRISCIQYMNEDWSIKHFNGGRLIK